MTAPTCTTLIIGAGISGLLAGNILVQSGQKVTILEKSRSVGGRMATRRIQGGVFDHGAQFFTVRKAGFQSWVTNWLASGIVQEWTRGFASKGNLVPGVGHPRYCGTNGMASIAKNLSQGLAIHRQTTVESIARVGDLWEACISNGQSFTAATLILTAPVPQSLVLLRNGQVTIPAEDEAALDRLQYHPCIALLLVLDSPSAIPHPGGIRLEEGVVQWLGDNAQKGISSQVPAITVHATADFSISHFDLSPGILANHLAAAAKPWLRARIRRWQIHKWRYSQPKNTYPYPFYSNPELPGLYLAGDAFGDPRIEGAAISGLRLGQHLSEGD